jgi:hypothetical protein
MFKNLVVYNKWSVIIYIIKREYSQYKEIGAIVLFLKTNKNKAKIVILIIGEMA